jgi:hypothetical protein
MPGNDQNTATSSIVRDGFISTARGVDGNTPSHAAFPLAVRFTSSSAAAAAPAPAAAPPAAPPATAPPSVTLVAARLTRRRAGTPPKHSTAHASSVSRSCLPTIATAICGAT